MKLSILILCWNDQKLIQDCLRSIFATTHRTDFEVVVSDNGSEDGSVAFVRTSYPLVRVVENGANLGFAKGNNTGIRVCQGEYILILNPDTIIHEGALDRWIEFADRHPKAGAFGCRVLNPDGTYQESSRRFPTIWRYLIAALCLRPLAYLSTAFVSDTYTGWHGDTQREIDWQSGCCILFRGPLLKALDGFDERFFYHFEEVDLCLRVHQAGYSILFTPEASITHLGGQSVKRFPIRFELEKYRNRYRYFYKHFGTRGAKQCRRVALLWISLRRWGYGLLALFRSSEQLRNRLAMYRATAKWTRLLDPVRLVELGEEPESIDVSR